MGVGVLTPKAAICCVIAVRITKESFRRSMREVLAVPLRLAVGCWGIVLAFRRIESCKAREKAVVIKHVLEGAAVKKAAGQAVSCGLIKNMLLCLRRSAQVKGIPRVSALG